LNLKAYCLKEGGIKINKLRITLLIFSFVILLLFPAFSEVYYPALYYGLVLFLVPIAIYRILREEKIKQSFHKKWQRRRKQGLVINMAREGLRTMLAILTVVGLSQFVINGRSPVGIISKLSGSQLVWILAIIIFFGLFGGIVGYYEKEKSYEKYIRNSNL
jgi:uncharacterized ion transporter superfamily protein YfcC